MHCLHSHRYRAVLSVQRSTCRTANLNLSHGHICPLRVQHNVVRRRCQTRMRAELEPGTKEKPVVPDSPPTPPTPSRPEQPTQQRDQRWSSSQDDERFSWQEFFTSDVPQKLGVLLALLVFSRLGVYLRVPGVDVDAFGESMKGSGLFGYVDALSGGSISKVGIFSLGIIPYINSSIVMQLFSSAFPSLKKMQREDGPQGRARYQYYTKLAALLFAVTQAAGQLVYIRPFVEDFSPTWLASNTLALTAGAMALVYVADTISELKVGNGTSVMIFASIASSLPSSVGGLLTANASGDPSNIAVYAVAFLATTMGIIYVQEAERRIPVNYSSRRMPPDWRQSSLNATGATLLICVGLVGTYISNSLARQFYPLNAIGAMSLISASLMRRYTSNSLARQSYLPFKVNATGVMPLIFASSLLALPTALARYADSAVLDDVAKQLGPGGAWYLPMNVALIVLLNYYYTFLQLEPKDLAEQLKRAGAAVPSVRPGKQTAEYVTGVLTRLSVLGSAFLGLLSAAPAIVEQVTHLTAFRGFAGTSVLIMVGVATDTARRIRAEQQMAKYRDVDKLYDNMKL